jgi:hypothetical protein
MDNENVKLQSTTFNDLPYDMIREISIQLDPQSLDKFSLVNKVTREASLERVVEIEDNLTIIDNDPGNIIKLNEMYLLTEELELNDEVYLFLRDDQLWLYSLDEKNLIEFKHSILKLDNIIDINFDLLNIYLDSMYFRFNTVIKYLYIIYKNRYIKLKISKISNRINSINNNDFIFDSNIRYIEIPCFEFITEKNFYSLTFLDDNKSELKILEEIDKYKNFKIYKISDVIYYVYNGNYKSFYLESHNHDVTISKMISYLYLYLYMKFFEIDKLKEITKYKKNQQISDENNAKEILDQMIEFIQKYIDLPTVRKYKIK